MTRVLVGAALLMAAASGAWAQMPPPGGTPPASPTCMRLEGALADLNRGGADPRAEQARRYEEAVNRRQIDIDRTVAQSRRMGCEASGFFWFSRNHSPQCDQLKSEIQKMRASLDQMIAQLQQLRSGSEDVETRRQAILAALGQNGCGPQYREAARPSGFFGTLFGDHGQTQVPGAPLEPSGSYRTVCVRTCDGYYFPISYSTVPAKFQDDERTCHKLCPAAETMLYSYRTNGEDIHQAVSLSGRPYTELPAAFRYRQEYNPACSCRRPGESWAEALGGEDPTLERGDIVVTNGKPQPPQVRPKTSGAKTKPGLRGSTSDAKAETDGAATPAPATGSTPAAASAPGGKRPVRTVGPQFLPVQ